MSNELNVTSLNSMTEVRLLEEAKTARMTSYSPYSNCSVGAALLTKSGKIYPGCNIENAAYSPGVCAERVAIFKAVSDGARQSDFVAIAVVGGKGEQTDGAFPPCGVCRQVMREFCNDDFTVYLVGAGENYETLTLSQLLPHSFSAKEHMN